MIGLLFLLAVASGEPCTEGTCADDVALLQSKSDPSNVAAAETAGIAAEGGSNVLAHVEVERPAAVTRTESNVLAAKTEERGPGSTGSGNVMAEESKQPSNDLVLAKGGVTRSGSGMVTVISDGTESLPHCSWYYTCDWGMEMKQECSQQLCTAAGYAGGSFLEASNDACTVSFVDGSIWAWLFDQDRYQQASWIREAQITATCTEGEGAEVISDGTASKPHCSWYSSCTWGAAMQTECAIQLCIAAGHTGGSFVSASNDACTVSFVTGTIFAWLADRDEIMEAHWYREAQVTALCDVTAVQIISDGTQGLPHCSWASTCTWGDDMRNECSTQLCIAAGYSGGTFVSASNDACTVSFTEGSIWAWVCDWDRVYQASFIREAQMTAACE